MYPTLLDSFYWYKRLGGDKFSELIDKINKVKKPMPTAAKKGVDFEDCINNCLNGQKDYKEFNPALIDKIVYKLQHSLKQQEYIEGVIETRYGDVKMYGFVDYSYVDKYIDLKTTSSFRPGKFAINYQHKAYPLINQLNGGKVSEFVYLVTDFTNIYTDQYVHNQRMVEQLIFDTTEFIEFLEANRGLITDKKIFNG